MRSTRARRAASRRSRADEGVSPLPPPSSPLSSIHHDEDASHETKADAAAKEEQSSQAALRRSSRKRRATPPPPSTGLSRKKRARTTGNVSRDEGELSADADSEANNSHDMEDTGHQGKGNIEDGESDSEIATSKASATPAEDSSEDVHKGVQQASPSDKSVVKTTAVVSQDSTEKEHTADSATDVTMSGTSKVDGTEHDTLPVQVLPVTSSVAGSSHDSSLPPDGIPTVEGPSESTSDRKQTKKGEANEEVAAPEPQSVKIQSESTTDGERTTKSETDEDSIALASQPDLPVNANTSSESQPSSSSFLVALADAACAATKASNPPPETSVFVPESSKNSADVLEPGGQRDDVEEVANGKDVLVVSRDEITQSSSGNDPKVPLETPSDSNEVDGEAAKAPVARTEESDKGQLSSSSATTEAEMGTVELPVSTASAVPLERPPRPVESTLSAYSEQGSLPIGIDTQTLVLDSSMSKGERSNPSFAGDSVRSPFDSSADGAQDGAHAAETPSLASKSKCHAMPPSADEEQERNVVLEQTNNVSAPSGAVNTDTKSRKRPRDEATVIADTAPLLVQPSRLSKKSRSESREGTFHMRSNSFVNGVMPKSSLQSRSSYLQLPAIEKIRIRIFNASVRAHGVKGGGTMFVNYWDTVSRYVCHDMMNSDRQGIASLEDARSVLDTFLATKHMRKLHNLLVKALLERCFNVHSDDRRISDCVPKPWRNRLRIVSDEVPTEETLVDSKPRSLTPHQVISPVALSLRSDFSLSSDVWIAGAINNYVSFDIAQRTQSMLPRVKAQNITTSEGRASLHIPGALIVDPTVRSIVKKHDGMKVTENAIWLFIVAVREYLRSVFEKTLKYTESTQERHTLPALSLSRSSILAGRMAAGEKQSPATPATTSKPSPSQSEVNFSQKRKLNPIDVASYLSSAREAFGEAAAGSESRLAYECALFSSFDQVYPVAPSILRSLHDFTCKSILEGAQKLESKEKEAFRAESVASTKVNPLQEGDDANKQTFSLPPHRPVNGDQQRRISSGGMGRGAKDLAALKARAEAVARGEEEVIIESPSVDDIQGGSQTGATPSSDRSATPVMKKTSSAYDDASSGVVKHGTTTGSTAPAEPPAGAATLPTSNTVQASPLDVSSTSLNSGAPAAAASVAGLPSESSALQPVPLLPSEPVEPSPQAGLDTSNENGSSESTNRASYDVPASAEAPPSDQVDTVMAPSLPAATSGTN